MKNICVYCGSSFGNDSVYRERAAELGEVLVEEKIELVYGGGRVGLMGTIAKTVLAGGGRVVGVIPKALKKREVALNDCTELHVVESMHDRKALMAELADGFIAMPGGLGTLDEMFEVLTWLQLGIHRNSCGFFNINGYFDGLMTFLKRAADDRFILPDHLEMIQVDEDPRKLISKLKSFVMPEVDKAKWIHETAL